MWRGFQITTPKGGVKIWVGMNPWSFGIPCGVEILVAEGFYNPLHWFLRKLQRGWLMWTFAAFRRCFVKNSESLERCDVLDEIVGSKHVLMFLTKLGRKVWVETKFRHL